MPDAPSLLLKENGFDPQEFWDKIDLLVKEKWDPPIAWMTEIVKLIQDGKIKQNTNAKLVEFGASLDVYPGADTFVDEINAEFDVNVVNPKNDISILEDLTIYANAFYSSIEKLLDNKDIKIDEHLIALIQSEYHHDDKIKNLFKKNRHGMNTRSKNKIKILKKLL